MVIAPPKNTTTANSIFRKTSINGIKVIGILRCQYLMSDAEYKSTKNVYIFEATNQANGTRTVQVRDTHLIKREY